MLKSVALIFLCLLGFGLAAIGSALNESVAVRSTQERIMNYVITDTVLGGCMIFVFTCFIWTNRQDNRERVTVIKENSQHLATANINAVESLRCTTKMSEDLRELVLTLRNRPCLVDSDAEKAAVLQTSDEAELLAEIDRRKKVEELVLLATQKAAQKAVQEATRKL